MDKQLENRYPGIRFFETKEQKLFFGRTEECSNLFSMIKVKPLVVLFAKSGIGKSSLINAGLIPLMEKGHYQPVKIRLQDTSIAPGDLVKKTLKPFFKPEILKAHTGDHNPDVKLWEYIRACQFGIADNPKTPVFIFDQFEEFFNHNLKQQQYLILALANLVNERLPDEVQHQMRQIPRRARTPEQLAWFSPVPVKILLSIRSDRMSLLDELSVEIPTILRDRFHLKPLNIEQASEAIVAPAELEGADFNVPPFSYEAPALQEMLEHLSNQKGEIESFQLQILCQHIEREVKKRGETVDRG